MKYKSVVIQKFTGLLIKRGNKQLAFLYFKNLLSFLKLYFKNRPIYTLIASLDEIKPSFIILKSGQNRKQIYLPKIINIERQYKQSMHWIIKFAQKKKKNGFQYNLNQEVNDTLHQRGESLIEKNRVYKLLLNSRPYLYLMKWKKK